MTSFEITIDLFGIPEDSVPLAQVRATDFLERLPCTCEAIVQRQLGSGVWNEKFSQKVLCQTVTTLETALKALRECVEPVKLSGTARVDHLDILFAMKQVCDCVRWHEATPRVTVTDECGLLDSELAKRRASSERQNRSAVSTKMSFDRILRAAPSALLLAQLPDTRTLRQRINEEIKRTMQAKLKTREDDDSPEYVYIMQRDSTSDYVKIGYTKYHTAIRKNNLQSCFEDIQVLSHTNKVPHASRIEKLVHTELMYFRRWQDCGRCGTEHQEWFEIDADLARHVVLRWSRWLACEPYDRHTGMLKEIWKRVLATTTTPSSASPLGEGPSKTSIVAAVRSHIDDRIAAISDRHGDGKVDKVGFVRMVTVEREVSHWSSSPLRTRSRSPSRQFHPSPTAGKGSRGTENNPFDDDVDMSG